MPHSEKEPFQSAVVIFILFFFGAYVRVVWVFASETKSDNVGRRVGEAIGEHWLVDPLQRDV